MSTNINRKFKIRKQWNFQDLYPYIEWKEILKNTSLTMKKKKIIINTKLRK